ncbi:MAG: anaerobic ribonucleoside-triphosphate reductase activating protein [Anaerocolumna sp.]
MRYHNITKDDMLNGTGLRVVLWVAGCLHACKDCHNPVTWDINGGLLFDEAAKNELFAELSKSYIEGITLSGGDPLHPGHREEIGILLEEIAKSFPDKNIWLYTGYSWEDISSLPYIQYVDTLVDGKFEVELKDPKIFWRGSSNQKVIDVKKTLEVGQIVTFNL